MLPVVFINPSIGSRGFDSFSKDSYINHGLATIAAYLKKKKVECSYLDLRKLENWSDFRTKVREMGKGKRIIGITSMTIDFEAAIKVAKEVKKINPKWITVIGGVHVSLVPNDGLKNKCFDYVVTGEGELAMYDLVSNLSFGNKISRKIVGRPIDLDEIPHIDRDMFYYREGEMNSPIMLDMPLPYATIITSRGCPFNCAFCQPAEKMVFGGKVRLRSISDVVLEIAELKKKYKIKSYLIHDDLFFMEKNRIEEFVELMIKMKLKMQFVCQARADLIVKMPEMLAKLKKVGLHGVMIGFESGSQRVLDYMSKGTTVEDNLRAAKICHRLGVKIWANYMLGIPTESYWEMWQTIMMIVKINPECHSPAFFTPYPQTRLYDYCKSNNLLLFKKYSEYSRGIVGDKIRGFNYTIMRTMLFLIMPFQMKLDGLRFLIRRIGKI